MPVIPLVLTIASILERTSKEGIRAAAEAAAKRSKTNFELGLRKGQDVAAKLCALADFEDETRSYALNEAVTAEVRLLCESLREEADDLACATSSRENAAHFTTMKGWRVRDCSPAIFPKESLSARFHEGLAHRIGTHCSALETAIRDQYKASEPLDDNVLQFLARFHQFVQSLNRITELR